MENYQRRKLYRIHLKNISEIKNCRSPRNHIAYPSRLYNFDLVMSTKKSARQTANQRSPQKNSLQNSKRLQQNYLINFQRQKQNFRLSSRLLNASGSINMHKYEKQYEEHRKIMKMHRKVKEKRVIMYRFHDIKFKGLTPNLTQIFSIYDITKAQKKTNFISKKIRCAKTSQKVRNTDNPSQLTHHEHHEPLEESKEETKPHDFHLTNPKKFITSPSNLGETDFLHAHDFLSAKTSLHKQELLLTGNIFELRKSMIKGYKDEKIKLRVVGRMTGQICLQEMEMIPIMHNRQIIGSVIVQIC